jgi:hypothetical protein
MAVAMQNLLIDEGRRPRASPLTIDATGPSPDGLIVSVDISTALAGSRMTAARTPPPIAQCVSRCSADARQAPARQ